MLGNQNNEDISVHFVQQDNIKFDEVDSEEDEEGSDEEEEQNEEDDFDQQRNRFHGGSGHEYQGNGNLLTSNFPAY